jgi:hypothetical protein
MAKSKASGNDRAKGRSQIKKPLSGTWTRRDDKTGKFMDVRADPKPFKGVRRSKSTEVMERTTERFSDLMRSKHMILLSRSVGFRGYGTSPAYVPPSDDPTPAITAQSRGRLRLSSNP